jgi:hypothetical protein
MFTVGPTFFSSPAAPVTDPYWADVILLLNAQSTISTDASSFVNTMTPNGGATINSVQPLFSLPTYSIPDDGNSSRLTMDNNFFASQLTNNEWCVETWIYPTATNAADGKFSSFGGISLKRTTAGMLQAPCIIGGGSYTASSASGAFSLNTWTYLTLVRDNTTDPTFGFLRLFINGNLVGSSTGFIKASSMDTASSFGWILGYNDTGSFGYFSNFRVTKNHARYYTNFTPPSAPFPTS